MSTDSMVDDGESTFFRVRIRFSNFGDGESWGKWHRSSYASLDYTSREDAEREAIGAWRIWDLSDRKRDIQVEVVEVYMTLSPIARIEPAYIDRFSE